MQKMLAVNQLKVILRMQGKSLPVIESIDFDLKAGETIALLGESGCGKSLTALALMRLLPHQAAYGTKSAIRLSAQEVACNAAAQEKTDEGDSATQDLLDLPEQLMRRVRGRRLAIIFQEPMTALNPVLNIGQQLAEAIQRHQQLTHHDLRARMLSLLQEVEMPQPEKRLRQYPHQLSGGQKQRIMIAMALANNPEVLIADEPTTALDVTIQAQILELLKKLQQRYRMSILLITHDLGVVKTMADSVCVMYAGQIVEYATARAFFTQALHPYAQQLLVSLPSVTKRHHHLQTIKGTVPSLDAMPSGCRFHTRCAHVFELCPTADPALQTMGDRKVRCHLYPSHTKPPKLPEVQTPWTAATQSDQIVLSVENLSVYYGGSRGLLPAKTEVFKAVDGLSFNVIQGKTLALVGESGCGKTTVSRALLRLIPATSGKVIYRGHNVLTLGGKSLRNFRKKAPIIFQDPFSSMNPRMTVGDIIAEGMQAQGLSSRAITQKQKVVLEQVGLPQSSLQRYPHQFSGGQRQRICIARALATSPELLICDEPTSALDISVQAQILNLLKSLQQEFGLTYLFITHNMGVVGYIADDVLVMQAGKAIEQGDCQTLLTAPKEPYTRQLLQAVLAV